MPFDAKISEGELPDARLARIMREQISLLGGFGPFQRLMSSFAELGGKAYAPRYRCPFCHGVKVVDAPGGKGQVKCPGCNGGGVV